MTEPTALSSGSWMPPMSIPFILSQETPLRQKPEKRVDEPEIGVLTRTVVRSPVVKWILPVNIRHKNKRDVVFVGSHSIELKEVSEGRHLLSIAIKTDFDSEIRAARVFGEDRRRFTDPSQERHNHPPGNNSDIMLMDIDTKQVPELPPQMIVLSLQSGYRDSLAFLFAYHDLHREVRFLSSTHPLPAERQQAHRLGAQIAVDPRSRAMAVAPQAGRLMILMLKSRETMRRELEIPEGLKSQNFNPILQERMLDINGVLLKMEFLHPPRGPGHNNCIVLAIVVRPFAMSPQGKTYLRYVEWESSKNLRDVEFNWQGFPLPNNEQSPSLLIPLTISTGALLVCRDRMYMYRNVLAGYNNPMEYQYHDHSNDDVRSTEPEEPGSSRGMPLCTGWARAVRYLAYSKTVDSLYLCREDGAVTFYELKTDGNPTEHFVGKLNVNVDTAFACLDLEKDEFQDRHEIVDRGSYDVLVIGGNMSDGGLFQFMTRKKSIPRFQVLRNWAPALDFAVISKPAKEGNRSVERITAPCSLSKKDRIFACADRGFRHGTICEMRFGVEAQSAFEIPLYKIDSIDGNSMTGFWIFPEHRGHGFPSKPESFPLDSVNRQDHAVVYVSYPDGTERFTISWEGQIIENSSHSYTEKLMDRFQETIAASTTVEQKAIYITGSSLRALAIPSGDRQESLLYEYHFQSQRIAQASIDGRLSICLLSLRGPINSSLQLWKLSTSGKQIQGWTKGSTPVELHQETSCVSLLSCTSEMLAIVGTVDGKITVYSCSTTGILPLCDYRFEGDTAICESVCVIKKPQNDVKTSDPVVICGLRNGTVHVLLLRRSGPVSYDLKFCEKLEIELEPVLVTPETVSQLIVDDLPTRALILSRDCFCRLFYRTSDANDITVQCIWITRSESHAMDQSQVSAVAQYSPWDRGGSAFDKLLFCMDSSAARLINLHGEIESVAVPRRMHVHGTPTRVTYATQAKKLIVAFEHVVVPDQSYSNCHSRRHLERRRVYPVVQIIDPDSQNVGVQSLMKEEDDDTDPELPPSCTVIGNSGEKIMGLLEWLPTLGGRTWCLLAINTLRVKRHGAHEEGCIYIYNFKRTDQEPKLTFKEASAQDHPVYAMAPIGPDALVFCTGTDLVIKQLKLQDDKLKFSSIAKVSLRSTARHISVVGSDIYVSTAKHSVVLFTLEGQDLIEKLNDCESRRGFHNVVIPSRSFVLASDLSGTVRGLHRPTRDPVDAGFRPLFEAVLPASISRLRVASFNPRRGSGGDLDRQEVIGSAFDGSFYSFEFLGLDEWRLLRFIQNLVSKNASICPFSHQDHINLSIEPEKNEQTMHIDGDILSRLFRDGNSRAASFLNEAMSAYISNEDQVTPAEIRRSRFASLIRAVLPNASDQNLFEVAVTYLRGVLQMDV